MKKKDPLVSIVVITYNSSKYVLETLESAKAQTYDNIELIISDDGSTDETLRICKDWLEKNKERFKYSKLITVSKNTGIPANCNRGVKASIGEWIKIIAGDDLLMNRCISINYYHAKKTNKALYYSKVHVFGNYGYLKRITENYNKVSKWFGKKNQIKMKKSYLRYPIMINVPTFFIKAEVLKNLGYYDEQFKLLEDQPFLIKLFLNNYEVEFINVTTVKYRHYESSVMNSSSNQFVKNLFDCYMIFARPNLKKNNIKDIFFRLYRDYSFKIYMKDKKMNFFESNVYRLKNIIYRFS